MLVNFVLQSFEKITMTAVGSACNAYKSRRVDIRITVKTESKTAWNTVLRLLARHVLYQIAWNTMIHAYWAARWAQMVEIAASNLAW